MSIRLTPITVALCLAGCMAVPAFAADAAASHESQQIEKLASQTKLLLAQVDQLEQEVDTLKHKQTTETVETAVTQHRVHHLDAARARARHDHLTSVSGGTPVATPAPRTLADNNQNPPQIKQEMLSRRELMRLSAEERNYLPFDLDVPGQAFVSTGPYVGVPLQYSGSNLIINSPSVNTDLQLLGIRKAIHEQLLAMGAELNEPYHSHLLLSGVIEAQVGSTQIGGGQNTADIDVTNVSLDAFILGPSNWLLGFIEFSYDNGLLPHGFAPVTNFYRFANSRVYVNKAFITIGDLTRSPIYGTIGQMYVPYGRYSSVMISDPLTKPVGRTKARAILLGIQMQGDNAFYGSAYVFPGDTYTKTKGSINNGGLNLGYKYKFGKGFFHGDFGGGAIVNIADGAGMQLGNGFAQPSPTGTSSPEKISHQVPAFNARGVFSFGEHIDVIAELIQAFRPFNVNDMSYDGKGAKPSAYDIEAAYSFMIWDFPSAIGIGYSKSYQALTIGIPLTRKYIVFNTSLLRNTLQSLEFRHDQNYARSHFGNGPVDAQAFPGQCTASECGQSGKSDNALTAQFDYYF